MSLSTPQLVDVEPQTTAVIRGRVPTTELADFFDRSFSALTEALDRQGVRPAGAAFARYEGPPTDVAELEVGFPVAATVEPDGDVVPGSLPGGTVARAVHAGGYDGLGEAWGALATWIAEHGRQPGPVLWEVYATQPSPDMDPADLRTELAWLLA